MRAIRSRSVLRVDRQRRGDGTLLEVVFDWYVEGAGELGVIAIERAVDAGPDLALGTGKHQIRMVEFTRSGRARTATRTVHGCG